jgi:hypothetical protein
MANLARRPRPRGGARLLRLVRHPIDMKLGWLRKSFRGASLLTALFFAPALCAEPVPAAAKDVIAQVHKAASTSNYPKLRSLMVEEFSWSFGGDASADQAIAEWQKQPRYMRRLAEATKFRCTYRDKEVECPANAGTSFRAGFTKIGDRWKMTYFVEGD